MNQTVKKSNGEYFVAIDYHLNELKKYLEQEEVYKKEINKLKKENTELREQIVKLFKKTGE